jgi:hypothetical protein
MIIKENSPVGAKNKYSFAALEVGDCNVLDDIEYTRKDLAKIRSAAYSYKSYNELIDNVDFRVTLNSGVIRIYRVM